MPRRCARQREARGTAACVRGALGRCLSAACQLPATQCSRCRDCLGRERGLHSWAAATGRCRAGGPPLPRLCFGVAADHLLAKAPLALLAMHLGEMKCGGWGFAVAVYVCKRQATRRRSVLGSGALKGHIFYRPAAAMAPTRRSPLLVVLALAVAACSPAFLMPGGSFSSPFASLV